MDPYARLSALAASLRQLDPANCERVASILDDIAAGEDTAAALGLARRPGQRTLLTCAKLAERDRLLRDAAARFLDGLSVAGQASALHRHLLRYRASAWQRERTLDHCPVRHVGTMRELFWRLLKLRDHVPAPRSIRYILATS